MAGEIADKAIANEAAVIAVEDLGAMKVLKREKIRSLAGRKIHATKIPITEMGEAETRRVAMAIITSLEGVKMIRAGEIRTSEMRAGVAGAGKR